MGFVSYVYIHAVHSDQPNNGTRGIFDRLELNASGAGSDSNGSINSSSSSNPLILTSTKITIPGMQRNPATSSAAVTAPSKIASTARPVAAPTAASIFKRLGGKTIAASSQSVQRLNDAGVLRTFSGMLKRPASTAATIHKAPSGGVIKKVAQKVILVKKQPAKATRPDDDDDDVLEIDDDDADGRGGGGRLPMGGYATLNRSGGSEKCVSFSEEDEVLEFASRPASIGGNASVHAVVPVRDRLGFGAKADADAALHRTRKTVQLKADPAAGRQRRSLPSGSSSSSAAAAAAAGAAARSKSLMAKSRLPVHSRLTLNGGGGSRSTKPTVGSASKSTGQRPASVSSVFQRLGFND